VSLASEPEIDLLATTVMETTVVYKPTTLIDSSMVPDDTYPKIEPKEHEGPKIIGEERLLHADVDIYLAFRYLPVTEVQEWWHMKDDDEHLNGEEPPKRGVHDATAEIPWPPATVQTHVPPLLNARDLIAVYVIYHVEKYQRKEGAAGFHHRWLGLPYPIFVVHPIVGQFDLYHLKDDCESGENRCYEILSLYYEVMLPFQ